MDPNQNTDRPSREDVLKMMEEIRLSIHAANQALTYCPWCGKDLIELLEDNQKEVMCPNCKMDSNCDELIGEWDNAAYHY